MDYHRESPKYCAIAERQKGRETIYRKRIRHTIITSCRNQPANPQSSAGVKVWRIGVSVESRCTVLGEYEVHKQKMVGKKCGKEEKSMFSIAPDVANFGPF